jgi:hypothetical protein
MIKDSIAFFLKIFFTVGRSQTYVVMHASGDKIVTSQNEKAV